MHGGLWTCLIDSCDKNTEWKSNSDNKKSTHRLMCVSIEAVTQSPEKIQKRNQNERVNPKQSRIIANVNLFDADELIIMKI
jgi:hypothetical protein